MRPKSDRPKAGRMFSFKMNKLGLDFVLRLIFTSHFVTVT